MKDYLLRSSFRLWLEEECARELKKFSRETREKRNKEELEMNADRHVRKSPGDDLIVDVDFIQRN